MSMPSSRSGALIFCALLLTAAQGWLSELRPTSGPLPQAEIAPLASLEYSDASVQELRAEIKQNLAAYSNGRGVRVTFRYYELKPEDTFFHVMTRTMLDHDTLSTVNNLATLWDVEAGEKWLIPNMRGAAVSLEDLRGEGESASAAVALPGRPGYYFVPGRRLDPADKTYFNLSVFVRPVEGRVSSPYGSRLDPFTNKAKFHKGIDIACPVGTPVKASASGKVVYAGVMGGYGKLVIIEHPGGYRSLYGHLSQIHVKSGQSVSQGKRIADSGATGRVTGPHLHYEISKKGKPMNPHFNGS